MTTGSLLYFSLILGGLIAIIVIGLITKKIVEKKLDKKHDNRDQ